MTVKKKKFARKQPRRFDLVRFESEVFEGTFELPALSSFDLKTQRSLMSGDVNPLFALLSEAKVDPEAIEAIDSLSGDETSDFMKEWGEASPVPAPKSGV